MTIAINNQLLPEKAPVAAAASPAASDQAANPPTPAPLVADRFTFNAIPTVDRANTSSLMTNTPAARGREAGQQEEWDDWDDNNEARAGEAPPGAVHVQPSTAGAVAADGSIAIGGTAFDDLSTQKLVCKFCSFEVLRFSACKWKTDADYYHFRNFTPDPRMPERREEDLKKLQRMLEASVECAAFACGCSWQSVSTKKQIFSVEGLVKAPPEGGARLEDDQLLHWMQ